jgi:hypothetical protein
MNRGALIAGVVFIALGVVFLLDTLGVIDLRAAILFPVLLIAVGVAILLQARGRS